MFPILRKKQSVVTFFFWSGIEHDIKAFNPVQQRSDAFAFIVFFARVLIKSHRHGIFIRRKNERNY